MLNVILLEVVCNAIIHVHNLWCVLLRVFIEVEKRRNLN